MTASFELSRCMFSKKDFILKILKQIIKAGVAVGLALAVIYVCKARIVTITNSLGEQRVAAFVLEKKSQTIRQLQSDFKLVGGADKIIASAKPPSDNLADFQAALESAANRNSLSGNVVFVPPSPDKTSVDYSVSLGGNIITLIAYLRDFESLSYFTALSAAQLRPQSGNWENNSAITLNGRVYTKPVSD